MTCDCIASMSGWFAISTLITDGAVLLIGIIVDTTLKLIFQTMLFIALFTLPSLFISGRKNIRYL